EAYADRAPRPRWRRTRVDPACRIRHRCRRVSREPTRCASTSGSPFGMACYPTFPPFGRLKPLYCQLNVNPCGDSKPGTLAFALHHHLLHGAALSRFGTPDPVAGQCGHSTDHDDAFRLPTECPPRLHRRRQGVSRLNPMQTDSPTTRTSPIPGVAMPPLHAPSELVPPIVWSPRALGTLGLAVALTGPPILLPLTAQWLGIAAGLVMATLATIFAAPAVPVALIFSYLFQNAFIAFVSPQIETIEQFNAMRGYTFVL